MPRMRSQDLAATSAMREAARERLLRYWETGERPAPEPRPERRRRPSGGVIPPYLWAAAADASWQSVGDVFGYPVVTYDFDGFRRSLEATRDAIAGLSVPARQIADSLKEVITMPRQLCACGDAYVGETYGHYEHGEFDCAFIEHSPDMRHQA